jgi:uncharacterized phage infection (PIP) family protein YhgE
MKIELMDILYTTSMLILAIFGALVITKTISRYLPKEEEKENEEKE